MVVKQVSSMGPSKKPIMLRLCKLACDFGRVHDSAGYLMVQIELFCDVEKCAGHGWEWVAIGCDEAYGV
jgi:hypothetical protein